MMMDEEGDGGDGVWGTDDATSGAEFERSMLAREQSKLERTHRNAGLLEGIEQGKERKLQQGFDQGFQRSSRALFAVHTLLGALSTLEHYVIIKTRQPATPSSADSGGAYDETMKHIHDLQSELDAFARQVYQGLDRNPNTSAAVAPVPLPADGGCCQGSSDQRCACAAAPSSEQLHNSTSTTATSNVTLEQQQACYHSRVLELLRSEWPDATL